MKRTKAKIFVGMSGGFGPLSQVLPVLEQIDRERFELACYIASSSAEMVKQLGYPFIEFPVLQPPAVNTPKGYKWYDIDHYWGRFGYADPRYARELLVSRVAAIRDFGPDLIISQFSPPTEIAARVLDVPLVAITQSCMHPQGKRVSWWEEPEEPYLKPTPVVNEIIADWGLEPLTRMEELNQGDLTLIPSFPEFDPVDAACEYIGPLFWNSPRRGKPVEAFKFHNDWPLVFVYTGNLFDSAGASGFTILQNVIKGLGNQKVNVLISTGLNQTIPEGSAIPPNIQITDWIGAGEIIPKCDLVIHHGGHGSCMLAVNHGTPALVIPTFSEREYNARQLARLGAGRYITLDQLTPEILQADVQVLLQDCTWRQRTQKWAQELKDRRYCGAVVAAEMVMKFCS